MKSKTPARLSLTKKKQGENKTTKNALFEDHSRKRVLVPKCFASKNSLQTNLSIIAQRWSTGRARLHYDCWYIQEPSQLLRSPPPPGPPLTHRQAFYIAPTARCTANVLLFHATYQLDSVAAGTLHFPPTTFSCLHSVPPFSQHLDSVAFLQWFQTHAHWAKKLITHAKFFLGIPAHSADILISTTRDENRKSLHLVNWSPEEESCVWNQL